MRATSWRRVAESSRPSKYEGTGTPRRPTKPGKYVVGPDEPGEWCPYCKLRIRLTPSGRIHGHAYGGRGVTLDHPRCPGSEWKRSD